ncbi:MAG: gluconate 2-dehydrogenase subunit 3 family protein [Gemmatimonadetes bacterium]|nr:gluconate 2-dehydrogenase subunit 3 family protein [Gemmatimonadota bacterium]
MTRRKALARVGYLLGGALSASTVAGVLAGCSAPSVASAQVWVPRTLSREQSEMVAVMGELIIPQTDTPGARAARVHEYIDVMLTDYYSAAERARFLAGLDRAEARARSTYGRPFLKATPAQQLELVRALSGQAYRDPAQHPLPPADPVLQEGGEKVPSENERTRPVAETPWAAGDVGRGAFFRTLKELVLVGYYTSEVGAREELKVNPMGVWLPDIPYSQVGRSWA